MKPAFLLAMMLTLAAPLWGQPIGPLMQQATKAVEADHFDEAITLFERVAALNPDLLEAWLQLGELYGNRGNFSQSRQAYQQALRLSADRFPVEVEMARLESWQGNAEEAERLYRGLLQSRPDNLEIHLGLAESLAAQDRKPEATAIYDEILARQPDNQQALVARSQLLAAEQPEAAMAQLDGLLASDPSNSAARLAKAQQLMDLSQWPEARQQIDQVLRTHPTEAEGYQTLASYWSAQGYDDQAEAALLGGLRWVPQHHTSLKDLKRLRLDHAPTFEPMLQNFEDNSGNRFQTIGGRFSFDLDRLNRLSLGYESRQLQSNIYPSINTSAQFGQLGWRGRLSDSLTGEARLGFTDSQGTHVNGGLSLNWAASEQDTLTFYQTREVLIDTAQLAQNAISLDQLGINYRRRLSDQDQLEVGYARGTFSDNNTRHLYTAGYLHDFQKSGPRVALGLVYRGLSYDHPSFSGYFSPSQYQATQAVFRLDNHELNDPWMYSLEGGLGVQSGNQLLTTYSGSLGYRFSDSFEMEASALRSNSALGSAAGFSYQQQTLRMLLRF